MRMFGRPVGILGRLGGVIMARVNRVAAEEVIDLLDVRAGDVVLEVGFGPGVGIALLAKRAAAGRIAGIDPSPEMVEQAKARTAGAIAAGRVDLRRGTVDAVPFPDASFDKAVAINSMQAWPDADAGLCDIRRVLKPGGKIALGFTPYSGQSKDGVTERLASAGFAEVRMVDREHVFCVVASKPRHSASGLGS
jgi:ubiquinone/menaquinone biosynthesis C-methylase UbiE